MLLIENKKIKKGSVAVFALIIMFILAVTTIGIITTAAIERKVSISTGNSTTAFQIAESGMERTLQDFKSRFDENLNDIGCSGNSIVVGNNTVKFRALGETTNYLSCNEPISKVKTIKSIGTTKQETRAIEQDVFLGATKLLLHLNGKSDTTPARFEDSSYYYNNHIISTQGSGTVEAEATGQIPFPPDNKKASALFSGGGYLSVPDSSDWDFGTGNFTVDFWMNPVSLTSLNTYIEIGSWPNTVLIRQNDPNQLGVYIMGSGYTYSFTPSLGSWYHIAVVRKIDDMKVFIKGGQIGTNQNISSKNIQISSEIRIGSSVHTGGQVFNGYIDELRISKGVARWWDGFTPPTTEYWPD